MATKFVTLVGTFTGVMTTNDDPVQPPLGIWGPSDPRPSNPIAGFDPIHGTFPERPRPPLGFWGPNDPRPTNPIAGFDPIHGTFPERPPALPMPPDFTQINEIPGPIAGYVWFYSPTYGWVLGKPTTPPPVVEPAPTA